MTEAILYIILGFLLGGGAAFLYFQRRGTGLNAQMESQFRLTAQEAVQKAHESFLQLAEARLKDAHKDNAYDLEKRQKAIDDLVKPVHENLKQLASAVEQAKGTDQALREDLKNLGRETAKLVGALRDPAAQGQWGEFILEGILDKSGLIRGVHYETQVTLSGGDGRQRPDAVIRMQDGFNIIVDSKAPLNEFAQRLTENLNEDEYAVLMQNLARQVRAHVKALSAKGYWENLDSPDFTVLFLPSEHMYSLALRADPGLVDFAAAGNVVIASPTLLMSLLRVVGLGWRQVELAKNAQEISDRGNDLYKRLLTFTDKIEKIGKGLQGAMRFYDEAVGSLERSVLPAARKFKDLQGGADELPDFKNVEESPRQISLSAEDEKEKKRA
jgi:DNA recombination protein RmuC